MAKNTFLDWDTTAANNTDVGGIGILGTNNVSNFDNALRTIMAQLKAGVDGEVVFASKSTNYTAVVNDNNAVHRFTANATLSLTAAATLGSGWHYTVFANGGTVTVDPNGSETINGATTLTVADGSVAAIFCDGTGFRAYNIPTLSGANTWTGVQTITSNDANGGLRLSSNVPRMVFTDTDTGVDHWLDGNSSAGGFFLLVDRNSEGSNPSFRVDVAAAAGVMTLGATYANFTQPTTISVNTASNLFTILGNQGGGSDHWAGRLMTLSNFAPGIFWIDQSVGAQKALMTVDGTGLFIYGTPNTDGTSLTQRASLNLSNGNWTIGGALSVGDAATTRTNLAVGSVRLSHTVVSSAVSAIDIALPSGYDSYELRINDLVVATDDVSLFCRFSYDGGSTYRAAAGDYRQSAGYAINGPDWAIFTDVSATGITIADKLVTAAVGHNVYADIFAGGASRRTNVAARGGHQSVTYGQSVNIHSGNTTANGLASHIRILTTSGNISSGTFTLIGYN